MNCETCQRSIPDFLTGEVSPAVRRDMEAHISTCELCRRELENLTALWTKLGVLPQEKPTGALRDRFYTMLEAYKDGLAEASGRSSGLLSALRAGVRFFRPGRPAFQFLTALLFLSIGLSGGLLLRRTGPGEADLSRLNREVRSMRQTLAASLLRQTSAGERLRGISLSAQLEHPDPSLLTSLIATLETDPNINVRLAAVDALYLFADSAGVKESLVRALSYQTSPLVQVALVDLLVDLRERRAVDALKRLISDERIDPEVKARAEAGLDTLSF